MSAGDPDQQAPVHALHAQLAAGADGVAVELAGGVGAGPDHDRGAGHPVHQVVGVLSLSSTRQASGIQEKKFRGCRITTSSRPSSIAASGSSGSPACRKPTFPTTTVRARCRVNSPPSTETSTRTAGNISDLRPDST